MQNMMHMHLKLCAEIMRFKEKTNLNSLTHPALQASHPLSMPLYPTEELDGIIPD